MNRRLQKLLAVIALVVIGVSIGLLGLLRVQEAKEFHRPHPVQTYGGTNYVVQLTEVAVGKTETGCVMIVLGLLYAFYLKPIIIRRMKAAALAKFALAQAARQGQNSAVLQTGKV